MLKLFKRVSGNKGKDYDNLKKKSCSLKIWQNCGRECPEQHTKNPHR